MFSIYSRGHPLSLHHAPHPHPGLSEPEVPGDLAELDGDVALLHFAVVPLSRHLIALPRVEGVGTNVDVARPTAFQ